MKKKFLKDEWKKVLDTFTNAVKIKIYTAIPYENWRKCSKPTDVIVDYENNTIGIFSIQKELSVMVDFFSINDGSFGEYLYTSFFLENHAF